MQCSQSLKSLSSRPCSSIALSNTCRSITLLTFVSWIFPALLGLLRRRWTGPARVDPAAADSQAGAGSLREGGWVVRDPACGRFCLGAAGAALSRARQRLTGQDPDSAAKGRGRLGSGRYGWRGEESFRRAVPVGRRRPPPPLQCSDPDGPRCGLLGPGSFAAG